MNPNLKKHRHPGLRKDLKTRLNLPGTAPANAAPPSEPSPAARNVGPVTSRSTVKYARNKVVVTIKPANSCKQKSTPKPGANPGRTGTSLVVVREVDVTERVRAISEGRTRPRVLHTVPVSEPKLVPPPAPMDWQFAEPPSRRDREAEARAARRERWLRLCREGIPEVSP